MSFVTISNYHLVSNNTICNTPHGSPPCSEKGSIPITTLTSFTILIIVVYDLVLIPKSSITADTAFRKDLSLQGCTTLPTRANRLLMPHVTSSLGGRQRVEGYTLFMRKSIHDPRATPPMLPPFRTPGRRHTPTPHTLHGATINTSSSTHSTPRYPNYWPMDRCAHASSR